MASGSMTLVNPFFRSVWGGLDQDAIDSVVRFFKQWGDTEQYATEN